MNGFASVSAPSLQWGLEDRLNTSGWFASSYWSSQQNLCSRIKQQLTFLSGQPNLVSLQSCCCNTVQQLIARVYFPNKEINSVLVEDQQMYLRAKGKGSLQHARAPRSGRVLGASGSWSCLLQLNPHAKVCKHVSLRFSTSNWIILNWLWYLIIYLLVCVSQCHIINSFLLDRMHDVKDSR